MLPKKISIRKYHFVDLISETLRKEAKEFRYTSKQIGNHIGVSERTTRNWLNAVRGPSAYDLIKLMIYSENIRNLIFEIIDNSHKSE